MEAKNDTPHSFRNISLAHFYSSISGIQLDFQLEPNHVPHVPYNFYFNFCVKWVISANAEE